MVNRDKIYKCNMCGNMIEKLNYIEMDILCCNKVMQEQIAKKEDSSIEKHVPFIENTEKGILIKIGENEKHPMTKEHYIVFIKIITHNNKVLKQYLFPGDEPCAEFFGIKKEDVKIVLEYCNLHGLWEN